MLSYVAILAIDCRSSRKKYELKQVSLSSRYPHSWLLKFLWPVELESHLQRNKHLPQPPPPLHHCRIVAGDSVTFV